jgi:hypothetical protein
MFMIAPLEYEPSESLLARPSQLLTPRPQIRIRCPGQTGVFLDGSDSHDPFSTVLQRCTRKGAVESEIADQRLIHRESTFLNMLDRSR